MMGLFKHQSSKNQIKMEKNYDSKKASDKESENKNTEPVSKDGIMLVLKRLLGTDKEHDIHGLSEFAWP